MIVGRVTVSPNSRRWYKISYPWMPAGVVITAFTATVEAEPNASDAGDPQFTIDGTEIAADGSYTRFRAGGGINGTRYVVSTAAATNDGQTTDDCVEFEIDNGGC